MKTIIAIPARWGSKRFPGKPLTPIMGKPMILHMVERAQAVRGVDSVWVVTDDDRIIDKICENGYRNVFKTSQEHNTGTDRIAEFAQQCKPPILDPQPGDIYINLQADEPLICPADIERLIEEMKEHPDVQVATLVAPLPEGEFNDPNVVKAVLSQDAGRVLYFSRAPVPFQRNQLTPAALWKHLGVYGYRAEALAQFAALPQSPLELTEGLEQLRWLENGGEIRALRVETECVAVDTPEAVGRVEDAIMDREKIELAFTGTFVKQGEALVMMATLSPTEKFSKAVQLLRSARNRVVVYGMGKSGLVGRKIAATLSSVGTPSLFIHPAEAPHGDLGMVQRGDVAIAISHGGLTTETVWLTEQLREFGVKIISITGDPFSPLSTFSDINLTIPVSEETIPGIPAPSTSSTMTMVMGDALAAALVAVRGLTREDFDRLHPANSGK